MKFSALVVASAAAAKQSVHDLSAQELAVLGADLADWEAKYGTLAQERGLIPSAVTTRSANDSLTEKLQRLLDTKLAVVEVSKANPDAVFSADNMFALMNEQEFKTYVSVSFQQGGQHLRNAKEVQVPEPAVKALAVDWTSKCNPPVRNQGSCGSCWAHSAVGAAEAAHCLATGQLLSLSVQQVTSCSTQGGSAGCQGGYPWYAIDYTAQGLCLDSDWPYTAQTGSCNRQCNKQQLSIGSSVRTSGESGLSNALNNQPVSVVVEAGNNVWKNYRGGVVSQCPGAQSDHAVIAVGYDGQSYNVKNSWGAGWGESGYIRLARNGGGSGTCNVVEAPSFPQLQSNPTPPSPPTNSPSPPGPSPPSPGPSGCGNRHNICYWPLTGQTIPYSYN
ncbi:hypothetical protein As57867_005373, partial [Aphanomyces stellatus]